MVQLIAKSVSFAYSAERLALDSVSLEVRKGELLVLVGANGAGKSTLLRALSGQLNLSQGEVLLKGRSLKMWSRREAAKMIALMPQFETTESELSVRDIVRLGRAPHRGWLLPLSEEDEAAIDHALDAMCLEELSHRPASSLSGGQWRRMILARAIAQQATVLLLDEPTNGLDLKHQIESLQLLQRITRQQQATVVVSLHDLNLASLFADRIALIASGRITAIGTPAQVLTEENLKQAFGISATLIKHPAHDLPMVLPSSENLGIQ